MRVLIADDHRIIRKSIFSILQLRIDIQVCVKLSTGRKPSPKLKNFKGH